MNDVQTDTYRTPCAECLRPSATADDEMLCNTGECRCALARSLCWSYWNGGRCMPLSAYDPDAAPLYATLALAKWLKSVAGGSDAP